MREAMTGDRFAITFGEVSTTHIGGQEQGARHTEGFSVDQLTRLATNINRLLEIQGFNDASKQQQIVAELIDLSSDEAGCEPTRGAPNAAVVLVLRNGATLALSHKGGLPLHLGVNLGKNAIWETDAADRLFEEQFTKVEYDRTSYNSKQDCYDNKRSRYNTVFTSGGKETQNVYGWFVGQPLKKSERAAWKAKNDTPSCSFGRHTLVGDTEIDARVVHYYKLHKSFDAIFSTNQFVLDRGAPNFVEATRNAFASLPLLSQVRRFISLVTNDIDPVQKKGDQLNAEGNWYHRHTRKQIGWHGDGERRIVVCLSLGKSDTLMFAWRKPGSSKNVAIKKVVINKGDIYFMSSKTTGSDWRSTSQWRLVHAAGNATVTGENRSKYPSSSTESLIESCKKTSKNINKKTSKKTSKKRKLPEEGTIKLKTNLKKRKSADEKSASKPKAGSAKADTNPNKRKSIRISADKKRKSRRISALAKNIKYYDSDSGSDLGSPFDSGSDQDSDSPFGSDSDSPFDSGSDSWDEL